ncbi:MAG: hypothetical protein K2G73_04460 [Eubacterium sp.]|nr:hypothetical protein [Eubacterium sp.]
MKKIFKILLIILSLILLFAGCSDDSEYIPGKNGKGLIYGPCIFYNGNTYVTPQYENVVKDLPDDADYWGTSSVESSEQLINGVLVSNVHNLDTDENVQITAISGYEFYKSADEKRLYCRGKNANGDNASAYYTCYVLSNEN